MDCTEWMALGVMAGLWVLGLYGLYGLALLVLWLEAAWWSAHRGGRS